MFSQFKQFFLEERWYFPFFLPLFFVPLLNWFLSGGSPTLFSSVQTIILEREEEGGYLSFPLSLIFPNSNSISSRRGVMFPISPVTSPHQFKRFFLEGGGGNTHPLDKKLFELCVRRGGGGWEGITPSGKTIWTWGGGQR